MSLGTQASSAQTSWTARGMESCCTLNTAVPCHGITDVRPCAAEMRRKSKAQETLGLMRRNLTVSVSPQSRPYVEKDGFGDNVSVWKSLGAVPWQKCAAIAAQVDRFGGEA